MIIYHNNRCSKSREALALLEKNQCEIEIRDYLKEPPTQKEIRELLTKLKCKALDIIRQKEPLFIELYAGKKLSNAQWIAALAKHPVLMERPIVINGKKAMIGRPPTLILDII
jgi:arsenate reductase